MSFETQFNHDTRENFKKAIDYPMLAARHPVEKIVMLDWQVALQKIIEADATVWTGAVKEPSLDQQGNGQLHATMQSCKGTVIIDIVSLPGDWEQRLNYLIAAESLTHSTEVNLKVAAGVDDLYLIPKNYSEIIFASLLYGNIYIKIRHWEEESVDSLAKTILQIMKENSKVNTAKNKTSFKVTADKLQLTPGDTFSAKVEGNVKNWDAQWLYNQPAQLLGDDVEYVEQKDNIFIFKALKKGKVRIPFAAMHRQTLYVELQTLDVEVN